MRFQPSRRQLLQSAACGFGSLALAGLCAEQAAAAESNSDHPLAPKPTHFPPRAKRVIFLFMPGGPGQMDTFDYKPALQRDDGKSLPGGVPKIQQTINRGLGKLMASPFKSQQHGESGQWCSDLFPHVAKHMDELCVLKGMHTNGFDHGQATLRMHTGADTFIRPSIGSWISYGLGTENQSLPSFVTICPDAGGGTRKFSNAFLPAVHQGTMVGGMKVRAKDAGIRHLDSDHLTRDLQQKQLAFMQRLNRDHQQRTPVSDDLEGVIQSFELAFRMQAEAPQVLDLTDEPQEVLERYGVGKKETDDFGRQCLMARRMAEAGVRFIQCTSGIRKFYSDVPNWDQHQNLKRDHRRNALAVDQPIAALLSDLKQRGLLEDTLVWWGGEFGRTSVVQSRGNSYSGRDHNPLGFCMWLAGGGVQGGVSYGETDEYGYRAVQNKVHTHDLHATILHLLGLDHTRLTYRYAGRDFRLTDVYGRVVKDILA